MWGKTKPPKKERETRVARPLALSCAALFLMALLALRIPPSLQSGVSNAASDDASLVSTSTREGRLAVFDDFWETIQERYYDPTFHGIDWPANRAEASTGETEFFNRRSRNLDADTPSTSTITSPGRIPASAGADFGSTCTTVGSPAVSRIVSPTVTKRGFHQSNFSSGEYTRVCASFNGLII